jgi:hypothetical protein
VGVLNACITNMLARHGRAMTLRRRTGTTETFTDAAVRGYLTSFRPDQLTGGVRQGDAQVTLGSATAPLSGVATGDLLTIDGASWSVLRAQPLYAGATVAGWRLWVRGG